MGICVLKQHTLNKELELTGIGLHSGARVRLVLKPAPPSTGVTIRRCDKYSPPPVKATYSAISRSYLATTIGCNGTGVTTVEHLLAALMGCGVDNVLIEVEGPEIPICDGSARYYVEKIMEIGLQPQEAVKSFFQVTKSVGYKEGEAFLLAEPANELKITYSIDFDHPAIGYQELSWSFSSRKFIDEIAPARTFGFLKDVDRLKKQGLALGGSLENAIVFDDDSILNRDGLRFADECVRHKILDFLGDLLLLGKPVLGHFRIHRAGHALHHRFLNVLAGEITQSIVDRVPLYVAERFKPPADSTCSICQQEDDYPAAKTSVQ